MTHVTCRLTAKNRDQLRNPTLYNRVWATFTFLYFGGNTRLFYSVNELYVFQQKLLCAQCIRPNFFMDIIKLN